MNAEKIILDTEDHFRVVSVDRQGDGINIYVESIQPQCPCPNCCLPARKVHSYYTGRFSDCAIYNILGVDTDGRKDIHNWGLTISQLYIKFGDRLRLGRDSF